MTGVSGKNLLITYQNDLENNKVTSFPRGIQMHEILEDPTDKLEP